MRIRVLTAFALGLLVSLTGCATQLHRDVQTHVAENTTQAEVAIDRTANMDDVLYRVDDEPWILGQAIPIDASDAEPAVLNKRFRLEQWEQGTLREAAETLSLDTGVPISVARDALELRLPGDADAGADAGAMSLNAVSTFPLQGPTATLRQLLDRLTARTGTSWRWTGSRILISHRSVRTYTIELVPTDLGTTGTITNASQLGGAGGGSGGGGGEGGGGSGAGGADSGNEQTLTVDYDFAFYDELERALEAMLSEGSTVVASPSSNTVTVRGTAEEQEAVGQYLDALNHSLSRQVAVEVVVASVDISDTNSAGIDWGIVRAAGNGDVQIDAMGAGEQAEGASTLLATVVNPLSRFNGTELMLNALRQQGTTSIRLRTTAQALHNQPAVVQTLRREGFLAGRKVNLVANAGVESELTAGYQTEGFSLTLVPVILDDQSVLLQVQGNLTTALPLRQVESGVDRIEIPSSTLDNFLQRAKLRSGSTLVLTGVDQTGATEDDRGIGSASFKALGGSRKSGTSRKLLVVMLTPQVLN